ncbi:hypothetical protein N7495_009722 [Penicillium taxi]|uniref:uncharacterized protein n=1 Tax=Penicillium taxi TaxID=168475 RepID=UPI0025450CFF|nr:uncharacterized protein N7495_009722 [Penicillium taxi]KAJ5885212.1 hypothetical protein N7495_009722 [Penicillium taxi]
MADFIPATPNKIVDFISATPNRWAPNDLSPRAQRKKIPTPEQHVLKNYLISLNHGSRGILPQPLSAPPHFQKDFTPLVVPSVVPGGQFTIHGHPVTINIFAREIILPFDLREGPSEFQGNLEILMNIFPNTTQVTFDDRYLVFTV